MGRAMTLPVVEAAMEDLRLAHRELLRVVDSLSDADWERPVPYGEWTVKDLIAHCIGDMSPSGAGLILAGVLTPQFIADTARTFDVRARNAALVDERRGLAREDLRQMLFSCHDAMHNAALKLTEEHLPVLAYSVPMGPDYDLHVEDWLWARLPRPPARRRHPAGAAGRLAAPGPRPSSPRSRRSFAP